MYNLKNKVFIILIMQKRFYTYGRLLQKLSRYKNIQTIIDEHGYLSHKMDYDSKTKYIHHCTNSSQEYTTLKLEGVFSKRDVEYLNAFRQNNNTCENYIDIGEVNLNRWVKNIREIEKEPKFLSKRIPKNDKITFNKINIKYFDLLKLLSGNIDYKIANLLIKNEEDIKILETRNNEIMDNKLLDKNVSIQFLVNGPVLGHLKYFEKNVIRNYVNNVGNVRNDYDILSIVRRMEKNNEILEREYGSDIENYVKYMHRWELHITYISDEHFVKLQGLLEPVRLGDFCNFTIVKKNYNK